MSHLGLKFFLVQGPLTAIQIFDHILIFIRIFGMKLVQLESKLKEIFNNIWIAEIEFRMRKF